MGRSTVSRVAKRLDGAVEALRSAPIEGPHPYLYLDATFLDARWARKVENVSALVAYAVDPDGHRLKTLTHPALLVVDEIGYLPVNQTGAMLFFQLINRRYERASTVLTSNKGFEEWGDVLGDEVMAAALIDRLLHHCHIVNIRGNSYRMRHHTELSKVLHSPPAESSSSPPRKRRRTSKETTTT